MTGLLATVVMITLDGLPAFVRRSAKYSRLRLWCAVTSRDSGWFREVVRDKGIQPCFPGRTSRGKTFRFGKHRNRIQIMSVRLTDWRRISIREDRCSEVFLFAVALAAAVNFWLLASMSQQPKRQFGCGLE